MILRVFTKACPFAPRREISQLTKSDRVAGSSKNKREDGKLGFRCWKQQRDGGLGQRTTRRKYVVRLLQRGTPDVGTNGMVNIRQSPSPCKTLCESVS